MTTTLKHAAPAFALGMLLLGSAGSIFATAQPKELTYADGKSEPSQRSVIGAQVPGVVKEILIKRGDEVKQGQPLIQQDDRSAVNQYQILEKEAESPIRVEAATWDLAQKQIELKRLEQLYNDPNGRGATDLEVERASLEMKFKSAQLGLSEMELAKAKLEAAGAKLRVDFMQILAPYDGIVERIETGVGEMLDPQRPGALAIVKNDPLRIVVQLPAPQAARLKKGDALDVRYKNDSADAWQQATVSYLSPVAIAGAGMDSRREIHLSMPNPTKRETGLWLQVKLPEPVSATADAGRGVER